MVLALAVIARGGDLGRRQAPPQASDALSGGGARLRLHRAGVDLGGGSQLGQHPLPARGPSPLGGLHTQVSRRVPRRQSRPALAPLRHRPRRGLVDRTETQRTVVAGGHGLRRHPPRLLRSARPAVADVTPLGRARSGGRHRHARSCCTFRFKRGLVISGVVFGSGPVGHGARPSSHHRRSCSRSSGPTPADRAGSAPHRPRPSIGNEEIAREVAARLEARRARGLVELHQCPPDRLPLRRRARNPARQRQQRAPRAGFALLARTRTISSAGTSSSSPTTAAATWTSSSPRSSPRSRSSPPSRSTATDSSSGPCASCVAGISRSQFRRSLASTDPRPCPNRSRSRSRDAMDPTRITSPSSQAGTSVLQRPR